LKGITMNNTLTAPAAYIDQLYLSNYAFLLVVILVISLLLAISYGISMFRG